MAVIEEVRAQAFAIPTDAPESDGTLTWDKTTLVVVTAKAGGREGLGYTYSASAAAVVVREVLAETITDHDAMAVGAAYDAMVARVRNIGWDGLAACAISAVDVALWDLKAKLLDLPLIELLGARRAAVEIYGSGGFTSYDLERLETQLAGWVEEDGCRAVKMKIGREPAADPARVHAAKSAIGEAALFVDANGAYARKQALAFAEAFEDVAWFEEPVSSDDLAGLHLIRDRVPAGMDIAAGEYGWRPLYFRRMLEAGAVDVLQADASRCGGITGFLKTAALAEAFAIPLSCHCAPALHLHAACAAPGVRHMEWFHDHVRIEAMLFDGAPMPVAGAVSPDRGRPGHGLTFKRADAERYAL